MEMVHAKPQMSRRCMAFGFLALGVLLLIGLSKLWPLFIILPGLGFMAVYGSGHKAAAPMAIPGMLITGTGGILLFQSITGYWESWIYAWLLYGVFLGIGLRLMGERLEERDLAQVGRVMAYLSGLAFLGLGFFVILITSPVFQTMLMLALFAAGAYLLFSRDHNEKVLTMRKAKNSDPVVEENVRRVKVQIERDEVA